MYLERVIPLTLPKFCPLCGKEGTADLISQPKTRIFVNLKGTVMCSIHMDIQCSYVYW